MSDDFERLFEAVTTGTRKDFLKFGGIEHWVFMRVDGVGNVATPYQTRDDDEKERLHAVLARHFCGRTEYYVVAAEAWMVEGPLDDAVGRPRPSEDPNRVEILQIVGSHRDGRKLLQVWEIKRDPLRLEAYICECDCGATPKHAGILDRVLLGQDFEPAIVIDRGDYKIVWRD